MTRVLHAIGELKPGGAETLVIQMTRLGPSVGWETSVGSGGGSREHEAQAAGATTTRIVLSRRRPWRLVASVVSARRAITTCRPDVVIAHNIGLTVIMGVALRTLPRRRRVPMVSVFHGVAAREYRLAAMILDRLPQGVVVVSKAIGSRLREHGLARVPSVVPNAVVPLELPTRDEARHRLGLPEDQPVALCLARLVEQKRHDVLLRAWATVSTPALLMLAGDGPLRDQHEQLAAELGIGDRVRFLGPRSDVPDLLAACDLTVLSSDWEGLPIAILESMSVARPVVATDVDGVGDAIGDGGTLVPRRSPEALATALDALLADPTAVREAGERARERVARCHDPASMMRAYEQVVSATLDA